MTTIHEKLRIARENAGFPTKSDAARKIGLPIQTVIGHEQPPHLRGSRKPKLDSLQIYAKGYNVPLSYFLD